MTVPSARRVVPFISLGLFAAAVWVIDRELAAVPFSEILDASDRISNAGILTAFLLTGLNYAVLTFYDQLAFIHIGVRLPRIKIAVASFVGYAIANSVGFAMLSGTSARYRFYSRWGVSASDLARIVVFYSSTFWLGLLLLGGASLLIVPASGVSRLVPPALLRSLGAALVGLALSYVVAAVAWRKPLRVGHFVLEWPSPPMTLAQLVLSSVDWALAVGVLYVLIPPPAPAFPQLVAAFLAAQLVGLFSHVPGGVGVFESLMLLLLQPAGVTASALLPALFIYRVVYYLVPLIAALLVLAADEARARRHHVRRIGESFGQLTATLTPTVLSVLTFLAGVVLLASGATPASPGRLDWLSVLVPLPVVEISHFAGSIIGVALLVVSRGIARRLDGAWWIASLALALGAAASLLKGADYEEATLLSILLVALVVARKRFDRKAALLGPSFSAAWLAAVLAVVGASVWLGLFAFSHIEYGHELWWRFEIDQEASRFLRGSVGATIAALVIGLRFLLRPSPPLVQAPADDELALAEAAIAQQTSTLPFLVFLRDKALAWDDAKRGFVAYSEIAGTWVALGDPVGPADAATAIIRSFMEIVDDHDGTPVFYQVSKERLHQYADFGFTFAKLGEEALVPLAKFTLEGRDQKHLRAAVNRFEREGGVFRVIPPEQVPPLFPVLRAISDAWLADKNTAEKGFSLGFYDEDYLKRFPLALVEFAGEPVAFANIWCGPQKVELSVDLMRYKPGAVKILLDVLFLKLMAWGKAEGYAHFSLGMAPLSGLEASSMAPLWSRLGRVVYVAGERFYNFQGLRSYKEKFKPIWEPRYLAYPGGLSLVTVLPNIAALISGGYARVLRR